jgi:Flp pilus assembly protein TadD
MLALRKLANPKHFQTAKPAHVANSSSASTSSSPKILTQIVRHYAVAKKKTTTVAAKKKTSVAKKVSAVAKKSGKKELSLLEQAIALGMHFVTPSNKILGTNGHVDGDPVLFLKPANEGKLEKSLQTFQLALRETPEDYFVHLNLGVVAERSGEMELAQHSYRKASSLDENELTPKYYLARVLATIQTDDKKGMYCYFNAPLVTKSSPNPIGQETWSKLKPC